jgi:hypothetical protein
MMLRSWVDGVVVGMSLIHSLQIPSLQVDLVGCQHFQNVQPFRVRRVHCVDDLEWLHVDGVVLVEIHL